jgi:hypothetical protein
VIAAALFSVMASSALFQEGEALLRRIDADYWDAERRLYREAFQAGESHREPAFNWGVGVMLSALNAWAPYSTSARARLEVYRVSLRQYWNPRGPVPGFDVVPNPQGVDRYYDDNAWMALALLDTHAITGDPKDLEFALGALRYALSGESEALGGGIYWRESDKASKNTCSNTPTAWAALRAHQATGDASFRQAAERITAWTLDKLQDPTDKLMWDNVSLEGRIEKTKWSYNSALTILASAELSRLEARPPAEAEAMFDQAWARWHREDGAIKDPSMFAHLLLEAGLHLDRISEAEQEAIAQRLLSSARDRRYGERWDGPMPSPNERLMLIHQASALRAMAELYRRQRQAEGQKAGQ